MYFMFSRIIHKPNKEWTEIIGGGFRYEAGKNITQA